MFSRALNQCFNRKRRLFCQNQRNFVGRLPIKIFYFEDFEWSFFGKIVGQKQLYSRTKKDKIKVASLALKGHCSYNLVSK